MEKNLPLVVLGWVKEGKIALSHLPDNSLCYVKENAVFLQDLCGLDHWGLGQLLFPDSNSKNSTQVLTAKLLNRGTLEEVARVPVVLGFNQSVVFRKDFRTKIIEYVKSLGELTWEESVFSALPTCEKCGTASLTAKAKFCANCGKKL